MINKAFNRSLRARGMSLQRLAEQLGLKSHGHLSEVLRNRRSQDMDADRGWRRC